MAERSKDWIEPDIRFGTAEEWTAFGERHTRFLERWPKLQDALRVAFIRTLEKVEKLDALVT